MLIILVIIVFTLLGVYEFIPLYRQKLWRDFWVDIAIGAFSFTAVILLYFNIKIPSPSKPIREFITSIFGK